MQKLRRFRYFVQLTVGLTVQNQQMNLLKTVDLKLIKCYNKNDIT